MDKSAENSMKLSSIQQNADSSAIENVNRIASL
jgi:hypothetical protein